MTSHRAGNSAVFDIAFKSEGRKKEGRKTKRYYNTGYSHLVTPPGKSPDEQGSTLLIERDVVLSLWYSDSQLGKRIVCKQ